MTGLRSTSALAAAAQKPVKVRSTQAAILAVFREHGSLTDDALVKHYSDLQKASVNVPLVTPQAIRTRRHELTVAGRIRESGRGRSNLGFPATVWALTED